MSNGNSSSVGGSKTKNDKPPISVVKKKHKKIKKSYIIAAIILVAVIGGYYYYKQKQASSNQVQYISQAVEKGTLTSSISASGNVVVDQSASIDPTITGTVASVAVQVGDQVKKGQLLFTIVNDQLGVTVQQANSSYASAQTQLKSAKAQQDSAQANLKSDQNKNKATAGSVPHEGIEADKKQISASKASIASAQASLDSASANLNYQQEQAGKRSVMSPIDGTVNAVNIKNGDDLSRISSGNNAVAPIVVGDLGTLKAQVQVNEVDVANVSIGQQAVLTFDALPGFSATGKVEKMDSLGTLSQGVVTYNVTIGLDSLDSRIKPEMSVSASIITAVKQDVITVPNSALKNQAGNYYVQILNGTMPEQRNVQIGSANSTDTEITNGLNIGDQVVTQTINSSATSGTSTSSAAGGLRLPGLGGGFGGGGGGGGGANRGSTGGGRPAGD